MFNKITKAVLMLLILFSAFKVGGYEGLLPASILMLFFTIAL